MLGYIPETESDTDDPNDPDFYPKRMDFYAKGKKESEVFKKLHDLFWEWRRKQILERDKFKCVKCGSPFGISVDHIKNRSAGGTHNSLNLQVLCMLCHTEKTALKGVWRPINHG